MGRRGNDGIIAVGAVVALRLPEYRCCIGRVAKIDGDWVTLDLLDPWIGFFSYGQETFRLSEVVGFMTAHRMSPNEARSQGWTESAIKDGPIFDVVPLELYRDKWTSLRGRAKADDSSAGPSEGQNRPEAAPDSRAGSVTGTKPWDRITLTGLLSAKPPPWVLKDYFRAGQVGFVIAFPSVGKSTLVAAWAMSVLHGRPWCGHRTRPGSVVCLVGEGRRGFAQRLDAFRRVHGLDQPPADRFIEVVDLKLPLSSQAGQVAIKQMIAEIVEERGRPPALVVIDTLSSHWAESEDSAEFGAPAMRALGDVASAHGCAVVVVHHTTKGKGKFAMPELADSRGTGSFIGNTDFVFGLCSTRDEGGALLCGLKLKDDEAPPELQLRRLSVECGTDENGEPVSAAVFSNSAQTIEASGIDQANHDSDLQADIVRVVRALVDLKVATRRDAVVQRAHLRAARGRACFDMALSRGLIRNQGSGKRPSFVVTDEGRRVAGLEGQHP